MINAGKGAKLEKCMLLISSYSCNAKITVLSGCMLMLIFHLLFSSPALNEEELCRRSSVLIIISAFTEAPEDKNHATLKIVKVKQTSDQLNYWNQ